MSTPRRRSLNVTGVVSPGCLAPGARCHRSPPGAIVEIDARLGDKVNKGQLLFKVRSTDIAGAYSDYRKAVKNEQLTKIQLDRANTPATSTARFRRAPRKSLRMPKTTHGRSETTSEHLRLLGADPDHPPESSTFMLPSPESSPISKSPIRRACRRLTPPNPFTISDLSHVWIICDVYENDHVAGSCWASTPTSIWCLSRTAF